MRDLYTSNESFVPVILKLQQILQLNDFRNLPAVEERNREQCSNVKNRIFVGMRKYVHIKYAIKPMQFPILDLLNFRNKEDFRKNINLFLIYSCNIFVRNRQRKVIAILNPRFYTVHRRI